MSFLEGETLTVNPSDKYLRIPEAFEGKPIKMKVRVLDQRPAKVFRHWIGPDPKVQRPYNCPSRQAGCAACAERQYLKDKGIDHRDTHKMEKKYLLNVLVLGKDAEVKVYSFGQRLGDKLNFMHDEYGDLRDYDITLIKRKTGPEKFNVEYDAIFDTKRTLTAEELAIAEEKFDLEEEVKPATLDVILAAVQSTKVGEPVPAGVGASTLATPEEIAQLTELATKANLTLAKLQIFNPERETSEKVQSLIAKFS